MAAALRGLPMGYWPDTDHAASWSVEAHLLASLIDSVRELTWVTVSINAGRHRPKRPEPVFRPGGRPKAVKPGGWTDFARSLAQQMPAISPTYRRGGTKAALSQGTE